MNLEKLVEMQRVLDERIVKGKNIQLSADELFFNTVVALDVELSEFANEGRWFKIWSDDQQPRRGVEGFYKDSFLEEFVDGVHFFLSLANQKGWQEELYLFEDAIEDLRNDGFEGGLNGIYLEMKVFLFQSADRKREEKERVFAFRAAWFLFISIGLIGFNFTWEQIEQAYYDKNKVNHKRQESGY